MYLTKIWCFAPILIALSGVNGYCEHKADIIFVLDSSGSESGFWTQIKDWVKKTVNGLHNIGLKSEIGLVAFDDDVDKSHEIQLTAHEDRARFLRDVDNLPFMGGGTRIDLGMKEALEMFKARRTNAHATVVLLTDGQGSNVPLRTVGNWFHAENIRVIVVGIGSGVNPNDLKTMCKNNGQSSETHDHYFDAANIDELVSARFIENSIEGCNFATDCHSMDTKLLGGIIGEGIPNVAGFKECARECQKQHNQVTREGRPQAACHYFTYYDDRFVRPSTRSNNWRKDCELHSQDHCGFYGSHCQQKEVVGVESGSLTSCEGKNFI